MQKQKTVGKETSDHVTHTLPASATLSFFDRGEVPAQWAILALFP